MTYNGIEEIVMVIDAGGESWPHQPNFSDPVCEQRFQKVRRLRFSSAVWEDL